MNNSVASGADRISVKLMKQAGSHLISFLVRVLNYHISNGIFPDARTVPIYKSGVPKLPGSYRPISVLSNFSEIFECDCQDTRLSSFYERMGLYRSRVRGVFYDLLKSYLLGRSQMFNICNSFSQSRGVPQQSV
jgi:hypothetical protein